MLNTCVAFVTFNRYGTFEWTDVCVRSFRHVFQKTVPLVVVDHNRIEAERQFLKEHDVLLVEQTSEDKSHGAGLDTAAQWAKNNGFEAIVFVEPDCVFTSQAWYDQIQDALVGGASMAATFRHPYGPLHPCGSGWILDDIPGTFKSVPKHDEVYHSKHSTLLQLEKLSECLVEAKYTSPMCEFFMYHWDVGIRNWFLLELKSKTKQTIPEGFWHFWRSHTRSPWDLVKTEEWPRSILTPWLNIRPSKTFI